MKTKSFVVALLVCLWVGSVAAHQLKSAVTTILFNERTGNIEIMHRFNLHDAEHAVGELFNKSQADIHTDEKTRALFAVYVLDKFSLATASGEPLELSSVGYQIDGRDFWVYQEAKIPADIDGLEVKHSALQELWPDQQNLVNIEGKGDIKSLQFNADDDELSVRFD